MTKAEFIAAVLPAYISKHADGTNDSYNAMRHANYAEELIEQLENKGIKFSEESTTSKENCSITDV